MNKKIYIGMAAFGVAASFWACGSGDILEPNAGDGVMEIVVSNEGGDTSEVGDPSIIWDVMTKENCPRCFEGSVSSSSRKTQPVRSSSSSGGSNPQSATSSSDDGGSIVIKSSSSSATPGSSPSVSSSSKTVNPGVSSSSGGGANPGPSSDFGTCSPARTVISKGDTVSWILKLKDPTQMISATTTWKALGGDPETNKATGMNGRTQNVKYIASGQYTASATVSVGPANYNISCPAIQVNGEPITGCKCVAADKKPDISVGAVWTVTGCQSAATIIGYTWNGAVANPTADTTATAAFTEKNITAAPTVSVANNDNTIETIQCDEVVSSDKNSPDYLFEVDGKLPQDAIDVKNNGCMSIRGTWNNSGYHPNVSVLCSMQGATSTVSFKMTYGTKEFSEKSYQAWGFSNVGGEIGQLNDGEVAFDNICVEFTGAETVSCKLQ